VLLSAWDLEETRAFLQARGAELTSSAGGRIEAKGVAPGTEPLWHTAFFKPPQVIPGGRVGFIAYRRDKREHALSQVVRTLKVKRGPHPNTARLMRSVWMVVKDLEAARKAWQGVGFEALRTFEDERLKARGVELARARPGDHPPAAAVRSQGRRRPSRPRGESICGVSIEVMSLEKAKAHVQSKTGRTFAEYSGSNGKAFCCRRAHLRRVDGDVPALSALDTLRATALGNPAWSATARTAPRRREPPR
jgi:hypothetical protein